MALLTIDFRTTGSFSNPLKAVGRLPVKKKFNEFCQTATNEDDPVHRHYSYSTVMATSSEDRSL